MKKILGIIGSPRKLGNCEIMVKEISRQITEPHQLSMIRLTDFEIRPCKGCYACLFKEKKCVQDDDLNIILDTVVNADALIVSTPTYFLGPNSSLKRLTDRGLAFYAQVDRLWGKPAVGIGITGIEGKEGYTLLGIESFLKFILARIKKSAIVYGALPGEVFIDGKNKDLAKEMAASLFGPEPEKKELSCPLCGGDTFRFLPDGRVRCMLCSNAGTLSTDGGRRVLSIHKGDHEMFISKQAALTHRDWLVGMKDRFIAQKKMLKEITISYLKEGTWIKSGDADEGNASPRV